MKKITFICLFSLLSLLTVVASARTKNRFSCIIAPSLALYSIDQWKHIPANRPPLIALASKVVRKEYFEIAVYFSKFTYKVGDAGITYHITIKKPDGTIYYKSPPINYPNSDKITELNSHNVYRSSNTMRVCFEPADPEGKYSFEVEAVNKTNGLKSSATASITLLNWENMQKELGNITPGNVMKKITFYYQTPQPAILPKSFTNFLIVDAQLRKTKRRYSPYNILAFFYTVLKHNKFLIKHFTNDYNNYNSFGKQYLLILLSALGPEGKLAIAKLNKNAQKYAAQLAHKPNPFVFKHVTSPMQNDILWCQFFATGSFAPIQKLVEAMELMQHGMSIKKFKTIKTPTKADKQQLMLALTGLSAQWSLTQNAKTHAMVKFYCEKLLQQSHNKFITQKLKKILMGKPTKR